MDDKSLLNMTWRSRLRMKGPQKEQTRGRSCLANATAGLLIRNLSINFIWIFEFYKIIFILLFEAMWVSVYHHLSSKLIA